MATFPLKPAGAKTVGVTYKLARLPVAVAATVETVAPLPADLALVWFSDTTGTFSAVSEAAYLLPDPDSAAGPVLGVAGFSGDIGGATVTWSTEWTPETGEGGDPGVTIDGARLIVWPQAGVQPGILLASATINGVAYGPVVLTVLRYACSYCYCTADVPLAVDPLVWETASDTIEFTNEWDNPGVTHTATVTGTWPEGTIFVWSGIDAPPYGFTATGEANVLTVSFNAYAEGTITASVTVTPPTGDPVVLGPVTLTVYPC